MCMNLNGVRGTITEFRGTITESSVCFLKFFVLILLWEDGMYPYISKESVERLLQIVLLFPILLIFYGCAAPQYDVKADTAIGDLQSKIHGQINSWISKDKSLSYASNKGFYDIADTDIKSLEIRMEATQDPSTANLPTVFSNLSTQMSEMRELHMEKNTLSEYYLRPQQAYIDSVFAALLTYELSLKSGGGKTDSTATAQTKGTSTTVADNTQSKKNK